MERGKRVIHEIQKLEPMEIDELFKMLHREGCPYTSNNNGVFINISRLSDAMIARIEDFIDFCTKSRSNIQKYESLCEILNHQMAETTRDAQQPRSPPERERTPLYTPMRVYASAADAGAGGGGYKISSTMRFYLLKKRFTKPIPPNLNYRDELTKDAIPAAAANG